MIESFEKSKFERAQKSGVVCVLQFWSAWCGDCFDLEHLKKFSESNKAIRVFRVNFEDNEDLAKKYSIKIFPSYLFMSHFEVLQCLVGVQDDKALNFCIKRHFKF